MYISRRRMLQLQALLLTLILYVGVFMLLFFRINISLFGINLPQPLHDDQTCTPSQSSPNPIIWMPSHNRHTQQSQINTHTPSPSSQTTSATTQSQHISAHEQHTQHAKPTPSQAQPQRQQHDTTTSAQAPQEHLTTATTDKATSSSSARVPSRASETTPKRKPRRGKSKWIRKDPTSSSQRTASHTHKLGQALHQALREHVHETQGDSIGSRNEYSHQDGVGYAHANALSTAYETFAQKSDKSIVRSSWQSRHYVYTPDYIIGQMSISYTTDRMGNVRSVSITSSSGNQAIDNALISIISSADLPPVPPEHTSDNMTRNINIRIRKAPGRDQILLTLIQ